MIFHVPLDALPSKGGMPFKRIKAMEMHLKDTHCTSPSKMQPAPVLVLLLATCHLSQGQDDLALAESRRSHGYFKGFGYGEFGFKDGVEQLEEEGPIEPKVVSLPAKTEQKQEKDNTKEAAADDESEQHKKLFEAFRDFYFKSKQEPKKVQEPMLKVKLESFQQPQQKKEEPRQAHKAISYAYSTINNNRYKAEVEKKAEERSDDSYYYYVKRY